MSDLKKAFEKAADENYWSDADSLSGPGSNLFQTRIIRVQIPELLKQYNIKSMLDAPCGDLHWMREIKPALNEILDKYIGADIVPSLIENNGNNYGDAVFSFIKADITRDELPRVDLVFTRDCFLHLSYSNIFKAIKNYKRSGARYLLVSTYTKPRPNRDVPGFSLNGRAVNLQQYPFSFSKPLVLINEGCTEGGGEYADKSLGLWELEKIKLNSLRVLLFLKSVKMFAKKGLRKLKLAR